MNDVPRLTIVHQHDSAMYLRHRDAVGPARGTILWIHGLGESALSFEGLLTHPGLEAWRHLAPDLPGYGKSPWTREPLGFEAQAAQLAEWLDLVDPGRLVVVGHSMGGVVGTLLCERLGDRVAGFVDVEGNVCEDDCIFSKQVADHDAGAWLDHGRGAMFDDLYRKGVEDQPLRTYYASLAMGDPRLFHANAVELVEVSNARTLAARLAALTVPTLYLYGSPRGTQARSVSLLAAAGVQAKSIAEAGHWVFLDQPEAFVAELRRFLDGLAV